MAITYVAEYTTKGRTSYSTSMSLRASQAISSLSAARAATSSPANRSSSPKRGSLLKAIFGTLIWERTARTHRKPYSLIDIEILDSGMGVRRAEDAGIQHSWQLNVT